MGIDIHGWIEARRPGTAEDEAWFGVAPLHELVTRNYYLFSILFGVHGLPEDMTPLAPARGLPASISQRAQAEYDEAINHWPDEFFSPTWITWAEIAACDWHTSAGLLVTEKSIDATRYGPAAGFWTRWHTVASFEGPLPPGFMGQNSNLRPGMAWEADGKAYQVIDAQRYDLLGEDWQLVFSLLERLAERYGADAVRMTVWFGN